MRLKKLVIAALSMTFVAGMTISAAAQTFENWYFNKYGYYPGGDMDYYYTTSDYDQYLIDNGYATDSYYYPDYSDSTTTYYYYYDTTDYTKYYADVTDAYWSGNTAKWSVDGKASKYQVRVYRDGSRINTHDTKNKSVSLASDINKEGYYYFEVRAYNSSSGWSDWAESDDKYYSAQAANNASTGNSSSSAVMMIGPGGSVSQAQWIQATDGTGRWWYKHADGGYTKSAWEAINGKWYYFDEAGWMKTGWLSVGGATYYLGSDGAMVTGVNYIDGANHNFDSNGRMLY